MAEPPQPTPVAVDVADRIKSPKPISVRSLKSPSVTDEDAQAMLISTLRDQVQDLFTQVSQLNGKLVQSYGRVADLEDDIHVNSSQLRSSSLKIAQLELERSQHLAALNEGILVEKSHVTSELSRLMERATDEAARRGKAELARAEIEKDLDDLSANLFGQANTMVAQARIAQAMSERKVSDAEQALKGAEDAVALMQQQMQALQEEKEMALREADQMRMRMGKGKWIEKEPLTPTMGPLRLMRLHTPYQEFLLFVAHVRSLRLSSPAAPALSTLLPLPLLARLQNEDT
jgi:Rab guanine nucleotide exchange factor SEC2